MRSIDWKSLSPSVAYYRFQVKSCDGNFDGKISLGGSAALYRSSHGVQAGYCAFVVPHSVEIGAANIRSPKGVTVS